MFKKLRSKTGSECIPEKTAKKKGFGGTMKIAGCLMLDVLMLVPILLSGGSASAMRHPGRIDGVDYTRVNENKNLRAEVQFTLGTTQFKGELVNGNTLSNDEIDKIIRKVMNEMFITCGMLEFSKSVIEEAKQLKGFDPAMALRIGLNVVGYGTVADIYDMYKGTKTVPDGLKGIIVGELSGEALKLITGVKWADIVLNAFLASKDIAAEWMRLEREKEIAELAMQRELMLEMFYRECNERLRKAEEEKGTSQWKLKVNDVKSKTKKFFGIDVNQIQQLIVDMERVDSFGEKSPTNWSGIYEGSITIKFWHNLDNFDTNFPTIFTDSGKIFNKVQGIYKTRPESAKEKSTLTKIITVNDAQIHIDKRNAVGTTLTKTVPLKGAEDVSAFNLSHVVTYALNMSIWDDGVMEVSSSGGKYHAETRLEESCSGTMLEGNRYPAIMWNTHETVSWDTLTIPGAGWAHRDLPGSGKTGIGSPAFVDYRIFDDLRDNMITLWIKNIDKVVSA